MTDHHPSPDERAELVARVREAVAEGRLDDAERALTPLLPADAVDVLEDLNLDQRRALLVHMADAIAADILEEMEDVDAAEVAYQLSAKQLAAILDEMESEEAADVLGDLPLSRAEDTLEAMDDSAEANVRPLLAFGDDTAGGRMSPEFVALPEDMTLTDAIEAFRNLARDKRGTYYFYAVDVPGQLRGVVNLRELLTAEPHERLRDVMNTDVISVHTSDDQESAARLMARYDLLALPVTDDWGQLVGVLQHEDLVDVLVQEATEDMYRLVGVTEDERPQSPVVDSVRRRLPWLVLNLGTQILIVLALKLFEPTIDQVAALAILFPIVTGQGGNIGAQTMTLFVRSMALEELDRGEQRRLLRKEISVGLISGAVVGLLAALVALAVGGPGEMAYRLAISMWAAMALNLAAGGLAGAGVPLILARIGVDPALASAMFVTTVTDTLGVLFFMGIFVLLT